MARQYHLKSFLRQAPNALLQRYFDERQACGDVPWRKLRKIDVALIFEAIENLPEEARRRAEQEFHDIFSMADEGGVKTLVDEARDPHHNADIAEDVRAMGSHVERAFWVFLEYPAVFQVAKRFQHADGLSRWRKRDHLPVTDADISSDGQANLGAAISDYYRRKEGRGGACQVDHYRREGKLYWFALPEDYAVGQFVYNDRHQLSLQTLRPAFEVIFVLDPEERSLDLWVRGDKGAVRDLQWIFGSIILGVDLREEDPSGVVYELQGLLSRSFPFKLEPADGVEGVRVRSLRLRMVGAGKKRLTLEADTTDQPQGVYDLLDDVLAGKRISRDLLQVTAAGLQLVFRQDAGRGRSLSFDVTYPDSCSLKYEPRHELAKALLKRWGIDVSGRTDDDTAQPRLPGQRTLRV